MSIAFAFWNILHGGLDESRVHCPIAGEDPLYVNGCIGRMLLTISSRDSINFRIQIIHLVKCVFDLLIERVSVLSDIESGATQRLSKRPSASSSAQPISNSIPTFPCFNQTFFSHNLLAVFENKLALRKLWPPNSFSTPIR